MQVFESEQVIGCDIDDTLIVLSPDFDIKEEGKIEMICPFTGENIYFKPRLNNIRFIKTLYKRGKFIVFWSQQGANWAAAVVRALGLDSDQAIVITKPGMYIDDLPCDKWMGNRVLFKEKWEK